MSESKEEVKEETKEEIDWDNVDWQNLDDELLEIAPFEKIPSLDLEILFDKRLKRWDIKILTEINKNFIIHLTGGNFISFFGDNGVNFDKTQIKLLNKKTLIINVVKHMEFSAFTERTYGSEYNFSFNDISKQILKSVESGIIVAF